MEKRNMEFWAVVPEHIKFNLDEYLNIKRGDARRQPVDDETVDIQITSSPYVTSYEYADLHQLSTLWLEYATDLSEYRKEFIGTSYKRYEDRQLKSKIAQSIVSQMTLKDQKMAKKIEAFFIDMQECFDETYRILKHGGRCCYVIGNTQFNGVDILNAEVFQEQFENIGFKTHDIIHRETPSKILPSTRDAETEQFVKATSENSIRNYAKPKHIQTTFYQLAKRLKEIIAGLSVSETDKWCSFHQKGGRRFAYILLAKQKPKIEIWCLGNVDYIIQKVCYQNKI